MTDDKPDRPRSRRDVFLDGMVVGGVLALIVHSSFSFLKRQGDALVGWLCGVLLLSLLVAAIYSQLRSLHAQGVRKDTSKALPRCKTRSGSCRAPRPS